MDLDRHTLAALEHHPHQLTARFWRHQPLDETAPADLD